MKFWHCAACVAFVAAVGVARAQAPIAEGASPGGNDTMPPLSGPAVDVAPAPGQPADNTVPSAPAARAWEANQAPTPLVQGPADAGAQPPAASAAPLLAQQPAPVTGDPPNSTLSPLPCRSGTYSAMIDGRPQTVPARLCQMPDGSWKATPE